MHLLKRTISPYTGPDRFLGVFATRAQARQARSEYVRRVVDGDDPWAAQAYRQTSAKDVIIVSDLPCLDITKGQRAVFVVMSDEEAMGQVIRTFHAICGSSAQAESLAAKLDARTREWWAVSVRVVEAEVGAPVS